MKAKQSFVIGFILFLLIGSCKTAGVTTASSTIGAVSFFSSVPAQCNSGNSIKQKIVKKVSSEKELESHYKITMLVRFQDKISPPLYGTLYYQDRAANLYCMALPDGRFASFSDSQIDQNKKNVIQEICFPIQKCQLPRS